jgi:hypothetical protein
MMPGDRPSGPSGGTAWKAGLGLRIWAKMLGMTAEEYLQRMSELPRPTTTAELNEASLRLYGRYFASLLRDGEELRGIPGFVLTDNVPRPPAELLYGRGGLRVVGPRPGRRPLGTLRAANDR